MLEEAAQAARQGMENTKAYVAKFGRAKSLMSAPWPPGRRATPYPSFLTPCATM